ncbi:unnamed protein product, partial [Rotaria socialis]
MVNLSNQTNGCFSDIDIDNIVESLFIDDDKEDAYD